MPGSDSERALDQAIIGQYGDTELRILRKIYGREFAAGESDGTPLAEVIDRLDAQLRRELRAHFQDGSLSHRIVKPARTLNLKNPGGFVG
jgi:hypothetical protein